MVVSNNPCVFQKLALSLFHNLKTKNNMNLFNSSKAPALNDFLELVKNGDVKIVFNTKRRTVNSQYRSRILISDIVGFNYDTVIRFFNYMGISDVLRVQSKDKWKKVIYNNSLLESLYLMDGFHQLIQKEMETDERLKTMVQTLMEKHQEQPLMEVCEDLPF